MLPRHFKKITFYVLVVIIFCSNVPASAGTKGKIQFNIEKYKGKFKSDSRLKKTFNNLSALASKQLNSINRKLGIKPADPKRIQIYITDANLEKWGTEHGTTYFSAATGEVAVVLFVEYYISGQADLPMLLQHELTHAVMRERMGPEAYKKVPAWFREGTAVFAAQEGKWHVFRNLVDSKSPESLLTGLSGKKSLKKYAYYYLSIEFLNSKYKKSALIKIVSQIINGMDTKKAVMKVTGLSWDKFEKKVMIFAREKIKKYTGALSEFDALMAEYKKSQYSSCEKKFRAFVRKFPSSPYTPKAQYYLASSLYYIKKYKEALDEYRKVYREFRNTGLIDESVMYAGLCAYDVEDYKLAVEILTDFSELYLYSTEIDRGRFFLAKSYCSVGNTEKAKSMFERVANSSKSNSEYKKMALEELKKIKDQKD